MGAADRLCGRGRAPTRARAGSTPTPPFPRLRLLTFELSPGLCRTSLPGPVERRLIATRIGRKASPSGAQDDLRAARTSGLTLTRRPGPMFTPSESFCVLTFLLQFRSKRGGRMPRRRAARRQGAVAPNRRKVISSWRTKQMTSFLLSLSLSLVTPTFFLRHAPLDHRISTRRPLHQRRPRCVRP